MILKSKTWFALGVAASFLLGGVIPTQAGVISAGCSDSFSLQADGSLWAWGYNGVRSAIVLQYTTNTGFHLMQEANQLGLNIPRSVDSTYAGYSTSTPTRVGAASGWVGICSPGFSPGNAYHTFGLQKDGSLWAWGYDGAPSVAYTTNSPSALYVGRGVLGLGSLVTNETFTYTNASYATNTITNYYAASVGVPRRVGADSNWLSVSPGSAHALALKSNGSLWSWGYDGMGMFTIAVNAATNRICNYAKGALGLGADLLVSTWAGTNVIVPANERVTNEYVTGVTAPTQIGAATNWVAAAAGSDHSLAVKSDGSLYAWGQNEWEDDVYVLGTNGEYDWVRTNFYGVLGLGGVALRSTNTPTRVGTDSDWTKVAAGTICSFAIKKDGSLWAWGDNGFVWSGISAGVLNGLPPAGYVRGYGRLGLGTNVTSTNCPTRVGTDTNWTDLSIPITDLNYAYGMGTIGYGGYSQPNMALKSDGSLWAWGYDWRENYAGAGSLPLVQSVPTRVGTDNDWVAIASGYNHGLALKSDGSLWAWGDNGYGQLGNNSGSSFDPVQVGSLFTWGYAAPVPVVGDYDGDGLTDFVLYDAASTTCLVRFSYMGWQPLLTCPLPIGGPGYRMATADFDGDGRADPAVYQESTDTWQILLSRYNNNLATLHGLVSGSGSAAAAADYDGDGLADPTVYTDGTGEWRIRASLGAYVTILTTLGGSGSVAVPADYNCDGMAEVATYQPSTGNWKVMFGSYIAPIAAFGGMSYVPAVADYDGDGKADPAIYEPSTGRMRIKLSASTYWEYDSAAYGVFLGGGRCIPVSADYDGDGLADPAVYDYVTRKWTILLSYYGWYRWTSPW